MNKPIIAILGNTYWTQPGMFLSMERAYVNSTYIESVLRNGGVPVVLPAAALIKDVDAAMSVCDGLLVPGGEDVHPWYYHEEPLPELGDIRPEIDEAWMAAVKYADEHGMPMLGICKGHQLLNVYYGGSLYQDLSLRGEPHLKHLQGYERSYTAHHVRVEADSRLARILGADSCRTNTMHHQAVKAVGRGLRPVAFTSDGIIEALEDTDGRVLTVQWHPEGLIDSEPVMNRLFADLAERAVAYRTAAVSAHV